MNDDRYPRVAIVAANPLTPTVANGALMRSLFAGWPKNRLVQVYFPIAAAPAPSFDVCAEYRLIGLSGVVRRFTSSTAAESAEPTPEDVGDGRNDRHLYSLKRRAKLYPWLKLAQEAWYGNSWLGRALQRQLAQIQPEIVYALIGNYSLAKITYLACARLNIPLFIHVTDDYVRSLYQEMPFGSRMAGKSDEWFRRIVAYADGNAGISPAMAEEFSNRYGKNWDWFTTSVDPNAYDPAPRANEGLIRFVYAGNLGIGRWRQLRGLALALRGLHLKGRCNARLDVYSSADQLDAHREALDLSPVVRLKGWARPDELPAILHDADILVHVESSEPAVTALTRFSLSTKLNQYLMAGRCILGFGPAELASMHLIRQARAGILIHEVDASLLERQLDRLCSDAVMRQDCGRNGRRWAERFGNRSCEHERFRDALVKSLHRAQAKTDAVSRDALTIRGDSYPSPPSTHLVSSSGES